MYQEAIKQYLKKHGYERIDLKAVLFDMDGVLFNSMPNHTQSWHKIMERFGFGLSLCKQILTLHGGSLRVTSEVGKGSCFTLKLLVK